MRLLKRGIQRVIFDYTPIPAAYLPVEALPSCSARPRFQSGRERPNGEPATRTARRPICTCSAVTRSCRSSPTRSSRFVCCPVGRTARKRLHFCPFGPRVRLSTHGGQSLPFVAAAACNADERPTVRWCHLTTNAESTGNMPTWPAYAATQRAASVSVAENTTLLACTQKSRLVSARNHFPPSKGLSLP
jgi:hypothetical protein